MCFLLGRLTYMPNKWHIPYAVLFLTHNCNLACSYCFARCTGQAAMTIQTAKRSVEWLFENTAGFPENPLVLSFFGGEPLIEFSLLTAVVEYAEARSREYGKSMIFSVTTNGTLVTEEMLDFFDKHSVSVLFSIDGDRQTNDRFRLRKNGQSPFDILCKNARKTLDRFPNTAARMTITPESVSALFDNIVFVEQLGFNFVSPCLALELFDSHDDWKTFDKECRKAAQYVIAKASEGKFIHTSFP